MFLGIIIASSFLNELISMNNVKAVEDEAKTAGKLLKEASFEFDIVYTSFLKRAIHTMQICLDEMGISKTTKKKNWRLNERHYGALQGLNKSETAQKYGEKQVHLWRRSYDISPLKLDSNDKRHPKYDLKYQKLKKYELPSGECLKDTVNRVMPFWDNDIIPKVLSGKKILIVAHGNSLRAIVKILDQISDEEIIGLNIPTGIPLIYKLDKKLNPIKNYYLGDLDELERRLADVISQGKSN